MSVNRCICHQILFSELRAMAHDKGFTQIEDFQRESICSTKCKLCIPYIKRMLQEGITEFKPGAVYHKEPGV